MDRAAERIITEGADHFSEHIWQESNLVERLILSAAAEEITQTQADFVSSGLVRERIQNITERFSGKEYAEGFDRLVSKEIFILRNDRYRFPVNLFRKWLVARHPLRQVREEI